MKFKINEIWQEGTIININSVPDDWCLVDIESDIGRIHYGISSRDIYGI
ncbi:MAG: hypothetical protein IJJ10_06585 [Bacillus sp. (in: Bacteria)]|nr:hypothetical protein [Bacillus sp. (in: firmicutes)]